MIGSTNGGSPVGLLWVGSIVAAFLVLALSWAPDSRMQMLNWMPNWLARWADSGGVVSTMRTGVPLVAVGLLLSLACRGSGVTRWCLSGIGLALVLVLVAECGQHFRSGRSPNLGDVIWGGTGALVGGLAALVIVLASAHEESKSEGAREVDPHD